MESNRESDLRELHAYMSSVADSASSRSSIDGDEPSMLWAPAHESDSEREGVSEESPELTDGDSGDDERVQGRTGTFQEPEDGVGEPEGTPDTNAALMSSGGPLTPSEIALIRQNFRNVMMGTGKAPRAKEQAKFVVPKEHPVFDGNPEKLELFIMDVQLTHDRWTMGTQGNKHCPSFIMKLLPYFKEDSDVQLWYKMWASDRRRRRLHMSWNQMKKQLREEYGVYDRPEVTFEHFWDMKQTGSVQAYISRKKAAAMLASEVLTDKLTLFGFIRGLKDHVATHVKLQKPETLKEAQRHALAYDNSSTKRSVLPDEGKRDRSGTKKRKRDGDESGLLGDSQSRALKQLRLLRQGKCFACGSGDHRKDACKAGLAMKEKFQAEVDSLKQTINRNQ